VDAMAKMAPVRILAAEPMPPGRFLIVVGGGVGEVKASYLRGLDLAGPLHDRLHLPEVDPQVMQALEPAPRAGGVDALGLFETASVSAVLDGADGAVKGAAVRLLQIHLARGIAGHAFGVLEGRQDMVEAALALAEDRGLAHGRWIGSTMLARPDPLLITRVLAGHWGFMGRLEIL
jgi:microcompartment protein CcmL/EutN